MEHPRQPNFIALRLPSLRMLQAATATVGMLCIILTASLLVGRSPAADRQAAIGGLPDTSSSPDSRADVINHRPKPFSRSGMNSVATGLQPDSVRYYDELSGAAFSTDLRTGKTTTLSDDRLLGFVRTLWVPGKEQVVSMFDAKGTREYRSYDYRTGIAATITKDVESLALSPDGRSVAFVSLSEDAAVVSLANLDGSDARVILRTRMPSPTIIWPRPNKLLLVYHRHDRAGYDAVTIGLDGSFSSFLDDRENLEYVLSPDGRQLLLSYYTAGEGVRLWYRDMDGDVEFPLGVATSARKCAWHSDNERVTCGVPANAELARDVPAEMMATSDDIITIDLETGTQTKVFGSEPRTPLSVIDPIVTTSGAYLSFINLFDRRLYSVEL